MHPTIRPNPGIAELAPYVGGASALPGANRAIKLSSNENPLGPSPAVAPAYARAGERLELYPDGGHARLRAAIAERHGIEAERILCGAGSDELIALLCRAYAGPGGEVVHSAHGFLMYSLSARACGATPVSVPERDLTADPEAIVAAFGERTRLVFLANPNNPTGTLLGPGEVARIADALPPQALLVLDAAYAEYLEGPDRPDYDGGIALVRARENVAMTRTFSKIHGLAALRLGWIYAPGHVIDVLNRIRGPFNVAAPALAAGEAAIRDVEYVAQCRATNEAWREWLARRVEAAGFPVTPSHANFLLAETGAETQALDAHLRAHGLIVRRMEEYRLPGHLRISVGTEGACRAVAEALSAFAAARA